MIALLALALAGPQEETRIWEGLYDARLVEAADGTPQVAAQYYEELLGDLPLSSPQRPEVLYWLGRTHFVMGAYEAAIPVLQEAAQDPAHALQAEALLARIEMARHGVLALPVRWTFDDGPGALIRSSDSPSGGSLGVRSETGEAVLAWRTLARPGKIEQISAAFAQALPVRVLSFRARTSTFPADLQVVFHSSEGVRFSAPLVVVPVGRWVTIRLPLISFRTLDPVPDAHLDRVRLMEIQDLTGYLSSDRGENTILFDDIVIE